MGRYIEVINCKDCKYRITSVDTKIARCSLELHLPRVDLLEVYDENASFPYFCKLLKKEDIENKSRHIRINANEVFDKEKKLILYRPLKENKDERTNK